MVLEIVSMVLAVAYVPKYSADIRRKGRDIRNRWGRVTREPSDVMMEVPSRNRPDAFSIIALQHLISKVSLPETRRYRGTRRWEGVRLPVNDSD